jgi:hypothetical protein
MKKEVQVYEWLYFLKKRSDIILAFQDSTDQEYAVAIKIGLN